MSAVLIVAEHSNRLAARLRQALPEAVFVNAGQRFPEAFVRFDEQGVLRQGSIVVDHSHVDITRSRGAVFLPADSWRRAPRLRSSQQGFVAHEQRAAWCALSAAWPGHVFGRLAPMWWLDEPAFGAELAQGLAASLQWPVACPTDPRQPRPPRATHCVHQVDGTPVATSNGVAVRGLLYALDASAGQLQEWSETTGIRFAAIHAVKEGDWRIVRVDPAPSLARATTPFLERVCELMARGLR